MDILTQCIIVFITQLVFIWSRTLNVRAVAKHNTPAVLLTGAVVHIAWLVGIAIGATSMYKIMTDFKLEYLPIVACSLVGGLLGSWLAMRKK
jgi:predicted MFS family arabinose efflux permease